MITLNIRRTLVLPSFLAAIGAALLVPSPAQAATGDITVSAPPNVVTVGTNGVSTNVPTGLLSPTGVVQDPAGNLFVADSLTNSITKFAADGTQTVLATGLNNPQGLILDPNGNLYVANSGGNTVLKITPSGTQTTVAAGLSNPQGLALDPMGNLLISNAGDNSIAKVSTNGTKSVLVSSGLNSPQGIALNANGDLLVADAGSNSIIQVSPDGTTSTLATNGISSPQDVALDSLGNLLVANGGTNSILKIAPDGTVTTAASSLGSPQYLATTPGVHQILNISTRGGVGTGDDVLIAGFIVRGTASDGIGSTQVLLRAIGPSLNSAGIASPLADPTLELHNSAGTTIATNNDWKDSQEQEIQATGLAPSNDRESAILVNLPDSTYTAVVRGQNNSTGTALVEVYKTQ